MNRTHGDRTQGHLSREEGGGVSASGTRVLSEASVAAMAEDQTTGNFWLSSDAGFGLGWDTVRNATFDELGIVAWAKSGGTNSYTSHVIVIPEYNLGVAISCIGNDLGVADVAVLALADILKQKGVIPGLPTAPGPGDITTLPVEQRAFGGYYGEGVATVMARFSVDGKLDILVRQNGDWAVVNQGMSWRTNGRFALAGTADEFYFQNVPGHGIYLMHAAPGTTGKAPISTSPVAQKLEPFAASPDAIAAWQGRTGTWLRATTLPRAADVTNPTKRVEILEDLSGIVFMGGTALRMYSADEARMFLNIPYNPGRDMNDAQVIAEGGDQWLRFGDVVWRPLTGVLTLPGGKAAASVTVGGKGYGEWRKSGDTQAQTYTVTTSGTQPRWVAYDENFTLVGDSACGSANTLTVPAGGYVQFLGAPGASFSLTTAAPVGK